MRRFSSSPGNSSRTVRELRVEGPEAGGEEGLQRACDLVGDDGEITLAAAIAGPILTVVQHRSAAKCLWLTIAADFCVHGLYRSFPAARYPIPIPCPPSMNTT